MLPPNLHEYMEEAGSAVWRYSREEAQGESCVHEMHMLFAGGASARTSSLGFWRLLPHEIPRQGSFRSPFLTCDSQLRLPTPFIDSELFDNFFYAKLHGVGTAALISQPRRKMLRQMYVVLRL
jgi:hypothetical protein